ncbi:MAG: hypothetical protein WCI60_03280 [bacterium]
MKSPVEILKEANEFADQTARAEFLRGKLRPSLQILLAAVFNPAISFPDYSDVTYKQSAAAQGPKGIVDTNLDRECRRLYIFSDASSLPLNKKKAKMSLLFESLHQEEVILLQQVLIKKLQYNKINKKFMEANFPGVFTSRIDR